MRMSKQSYRFGAREAFVLGVALLSALVAIGYQTRDAYADGIDTGHHEPESRNRGARASSTGRPGRQSRGCRSASRPGR